MPPPKRAPTLPLSDAEIDALQAALDAVPAPLEPLDASSVDGFLCGVLVQPEVIAPRRWLPYVTDADGRSLPAGFDARRLIDLVGRRHGELDAAIAKRRWFDPWIFELDTPDAIESVYPWVAGFATALELFPALMRSDAEALTPPLALVFRHLDPDDLEDADELLAEIESLEPPEDLAEAVEGLVRATLLIADVTRPVPARRRR